MTPPAPSGACPLPDDQPFTLASKVINTEFIAVDGEHLYWQADDGVHSVKKDGSELKKLPLMDPPNMNIGGFGAQTSGGIAVDKTHLYFAVGNFVWRVGKEGGLVELVGSSGAMGGGLIGQLLLDATHVYWVDSYFGTVHRAEKGRPLNAVFTVLATGAGRVRYLALDDTSVYWGAISRINKDGTGLTNIYPTVAEGLAVDGTSVYWLTPQHGVYRVDKDGQNVKTLYEDLTPGFTVRHLTQDATRLYFSLHSALASVSKAGGDFKSEPDSVGSNRGIAIDAEAVYWSVDLAFDGKVQKRCVATTGVPADPSAESSDAGPVVVEGPPGTIAFAGCPVDFAKDDTDAYVVTEVTGSDRNQVLRVPLAGGAPTVLEENMNLWGTRQVASNPRLSATHLYWVQRALVPMVGSSPLPRYSLKRIEKAGGTATTVVLPSAAPIGDLLLTATHVYWFSGDALLRQGFSETTATSIASLTSLNVMGEVSHPLLDGDTIFFEKLGKLFAIGLDGSNLRSLDATPVPLGGTPMGGLVTDGTDLFWTTTGSNNAQDRVLRMPRTGGLVTELSNQQPSPFDLAVDGTTVYWRLFGVQDVYAVPKAGGVRRTVALGGNSGSFSRMAISQQRLWWTSCSPSALRSIGL